MPDAGHAQAIDAATQDPDVTTIPCTTEEEGVAIAAGAWFGGARAALLMQSSGVGNCVNMFGLMQSCRLPLLTLVTMRGEWAEFNPWQIPMSQATRPVMEAMGLQVWRVDRGDDVVPTIEAAAEMAFGGERACAVLLAQRLIGRKVWVK